MDKERIRVCKWMFGGTLGLKETKVVTWIKEFHTAYDENYIESQLDHQVNRKKELRKAKFSDLNTAVFVSSVITKKRKPLL